MIIRLQDSLERREFSRKWLKTRLIPVLIFLSLSAALAACSEDSGWNAGFSGMPMNSGSRTGDTPVSRGTEESAQ